MIIKVKQLIDNLTYKQRIDKRSRPEEEDITLEYLHGNRSIFQINKWLGHYNIVRKFEAHAKSTRRRPTFTKFIQYGQNGK